MTVTSVHARLPADLLPVWARVGRSAWVRAALRMIADDPSLNPVPLVFRGRVTEEVYDALPGDWRAIGAKLGRSKSKISGPLDRMLKAGMIHVSHQVKDGGPTRYWYERGPGTGVPPHKTPIVRAPGLAENSDRRLRGQRKAVSETPVVNRDPLMALYGRKMK